MHPSLQYFAGVFPPATNLIIINVKLKHVLNISIIFLLNIPDIPASHEEKTEQQRPEDGETLTDFWLIQGMYTFENVGFTNTVAGDVPVKYMICADCEVGPIGWSSPDDKNNFYIALDRVKHV